MVYCSSCTILCGALNFYGVQQLSHTSGNQCGKLPLNSTAVTSYDTAVEFFQCCYSHVQ